MAGGIRGITVEIGGDTSKLGKALEGSEKQTRSLQSELKQVEKLLKFDPTNTELLAQKQKILTDSISETSKKLDILKEAEAQVIAQFERGEIAEDQLRAFQREIITTEKKLDDFKNELKSLDSAADMSGSISELDKLTDTIKDQEAELTELKTEYTKVVLEQGKSSDEAKELRDKMSTLNEELKENKQKLSDAEKQADKYSDALENAGDSSEEASGGFTVMKGALADLVSNVIQSALSAIGDLVGALLDLSEATKEYRTMQSKLEGSANTFGYSADFAKSKYEEFYKYLGDDQAATNAITNLMGVGTSTASLSKLVDGATAAWASYGDSINVESLTESINETITCGKVTGSFADTINWCKDANVNLKKALGGNKEAQSAYNDAIKEGLPVEDAFNEALAKITDEQERADVVAQFLNTTYGKSKQTYDELNSSVVEANEAELALKETQAELGETLAPVNNAFSELKNKALQAITPLVKTLADGFMNLYNWLKEHPTVLKIVTAIVIALAAAFGVLATALAIQALIKGVTIAFQLLNATILANPIVLIIAAIAALVAAFVYLWNNCEGFRQFWIGLWEGIKSAFSAVVDWFGSAISAIGSFFVNLWNGIVNVFTGIGSWFNTNVIQPIINVFTTVKNWIRDYILTPIANIYNNWIAPVVNKIIEIVKKLVEMVVGIFVGLWNLLRDKVITPIVNGFKSLWQTVSGFFSRLWADIVAIWNKVAGWFNSNVIQPIVKVFKSLWSTITGAAKSAWSSIKSVFSSVKSWFSGVFSGAWNAIKNVFSKWGSFFSGLWNQIKNTFSKIGTNIANAIGTAVKAGINGVIWSIEKIINGGISLINGAIDLINMLPGVEIGKISKLNLPRLAKGGIVESPTIAEIGENGREAIIPLENNKGWMREVAREISANMRGGGVDSALMAKLDSIYDRLNRLQIVLDTGALVGETIDKIDAGLAEKQLLSARGM